MEYLKYESLERKDQDSAPILSSEDPKTIVL